MSKRQFKTQASSGRAGGSFGGFGSHGFGTTQSSILSFVQEPPDYASISDPNIVVALKNLSKKDGTTKAKALEELQAYTSPSSNEVSEAFLEAWTKLFPRLSIDNARRVRQLAHALNGQACSKAGKRTAKHMPRIAGAWLAGTFDFDRATARAALDALNLVFSTSEKINGVRKAFQRSILEYCRDAALRETPQTLSDERAVTADDAEAIYARVVATSLLVIESLFKELSQQDLDNEHSLYEEVFEDARLWGLVYNSDAGIRRSMHRLVQTTIERQPTIVHKSVGAVSTAYVYKGLSSNQTGSALDFVQALEALTTVIPSIWTEAYTGKKSTSSCLRHFLKQGSQSATAEFWNPLSRLFRKLPEQALPSTEDAATELLSSARLGMSKKDERFNVTSAWPAYFSLADVITSARAKIDFESILTTQVMPVIRQYLFPADESMEWSVTGAKAAWTVSKVADIKALAPLLASQWPQLADSLIETAKLSQPEQAKDFDKSQRHVATTGERWAALQRALWEEDHSSSPELSKLFVTTSIKILKECIGILDVRNGKPYGAAAIIEQLLRTCGHKLLLDETFRQTYVEFASNDIPRMVLGPSQRQLIHGLYAAKSDPDFPKAFSDVLRKCLSADVSADDRIRALHVMFTHTLPADAAKEAQQMPEFQEFVIKQVGIGESEDATNLFADLVNNKAVSIETTDTVLSALTGSLSIAEQRNAGLAAIEHLVQSEESALRSFMSKSDKGGDQLLPSLLLLEQAQDDDLAERAAAMSSQLSSALGEGASDRRYGIILQHLERVSTKSLPIDAIHELTSRLLGPESSVQNSSDLLPSLQLWQSALLATIAVPKTSLAILSPLLGGVHLVPSKMSDTPQVVFYDAEGFSQALRISMYIGRLLAMTDLLERLGEMKQTVLALMQISVLLAEDSISVLGTHKLWKVRNSQETESAVIDFITETNHALSRYWKTMVPDLSFEGATELSKYFTALEGLLEDGDELSPISYYIALATAQIYTNLFDLHGSSTEQTRRSEVVLNSQKSTRRQLRLVAYVIGLQQPLTGTKALNKICNETIAELTDLDTQNNERKGLELLVQLNAILRTQPDLIAGVAKQRIIFLVKTLLSWLDSGASIPTKSELLRILAELFPAIDDMYGEHWDQALSLAIDSWTGVASGVELGVIDEGYVLLTNTSLRFLGVLRKLSISNEANDDLIDALNGKQDAIYDALIKLLLSANGTSDEWHQPLMITYELLARQIASVPHRALPNLDELYPLMYAPSSAIQQASFELLHKQIPAAQEKISFDAALDNKTAQLPDELLSLILEAPTLDSLADASFQRFMPLSLQGYLFSWRLLFDHFNGSSYRVRNDYIEQLKDGAYLSQLLDLTFNFLGHVLGRPVDVSKFDILEYVSNTEPSPERDVQWLLTHLYFLALSHLPSSVKSYYLDIRSRQTSLAVETWTAKYLSPLIVNASLQAVSEWSEKSVKEDPEYEKMTVKVGIRSREINVSYVVDEQTMAMKVVLPESYPLASAQVLGVNRVAVKEDKWQSWLRNCQGVITFSNGSITDGLSAWRRNVTGALKGQTECAICYSIISADKQLPTKRCPTCKNLFHSSCLLKWFKTSNASTCPLCRNPFNFN